MIVSTRDLQFRYDASKSFAFPDLEIGGGEEMLIIGKSGIGKTTLLHLLAGILRPSSGEVIVAGERLAKLSNSKRDKFRGKHIGIVYQRPHFVQSLTLWENLQLARYLSGNKPDNGHLKMLLEQLDLSDDKAQKALRLSQGQQQRATIAMAMANRPDLILADEPTSSLDDENSEAVLKMLRSHAQQTGATLIIITHDQRLKSTFQNQLEL